MGFRQILEFPHRNLNRFWTFIQLAAYLNLDPIHLQKLPLVGHFSQILLRKVHENFDFILRSIEVFKSESKYCHFRDLQVETPFHAPL